MLQREGLRVTVFDDESADATADVARKFGCRVIPSPGPLPQGWRGKTRACHELARAASCAWVVFLDADTVPNEGFRVAIGSLLASSTAPVVSGFPKMLPGGFGEPVVMNWVPWILLATNPFGLVQATGRGHNRFTNGQFAAWRLETLRDERPYEAVRSEVLEDVKLGRLMAKRGIAVTVADLSSCLSVRMYRTVREALDGMEKNSVDIAGVWGSIPFAAFLAFAGFGFLAAKGWVLYALGALLLSNVFACRISRQPWWVVPLLPTSLAIGALTVLFSLQSKRAGKRIWKGRSLDV